MHLRTHNLLGASKEISLHINAEEIKHVFMPIGPECRANSNVKVANMLIEKYDKVHICRIWE
jgi:hypothetical protein